MILANDQPAKARCYPGEKRSTGWSSSKWQNPNKKWTQSVISLHLRSKSSIVIEKTWKKREFLSLVQVFFPFFALFSQFFLKSNKYPSPFAAPSTKKRSNERHLPKPHLAEHHGAGPFGVFPSLADPELLQIANRNMERTQRNSTTGTTNLPAGHLFFAYK